METTAVLSLAFGLGLLHALDADHVMAVSALGSGRSNIGAGWRRSLRFGLRWALGHGVSLLVIGAAVLLLGVALPTTLSAWAEVLVGAVLVAIGLWLLWDLLVRRAHVHFHQHDGLAPHAHWHTHGGGNDPAHAHDPHVHEHGAVLVGVLHGLAGSAPLLALLPVSRMASAWHGVAYLVIFGVGVLCTMLVFSGLLGGAYAWLLRGWQRGVRWLRAGVALGSMAFGVHLVQVAW